MAVGPMRLLSAPRFGLNYFVRDQQISSGTFVARVGVARVRRKSDDSSARWIDLLEPRTEQGFPRTVDQLLSRFLLILSNFPKFLWALNQRSLASGALFRRQGPVANAFDFPSCQIRGLSGGFFGAQSMRSFADGQAKFQQPTHRV